MEQLFAQYWEIKSRDNKRIWGKTGILVQDLTDKSQVLKLMRNQGITNIPNEPFTVQTLIAETDNILRDILNS